VTYTTTKCLPSSGGRKNVLSPVLIASAPIFSAEAAKKRWLIVVVGAVGKVMQDNPSMGVKEVWVSDVNLTKARKAFSFSGALAKRLQSKASPDEITPEQLYSQLSKELKQQEIKQ
jgi:hypothetical protein